MRYASEVSYLVVKQMVYYSYVISWSATGIVVLVYVLLYLYFAVSGRNGEKEFGGDGERQGNGGNGEDEE